MRMLESNEKNNIIYRNYKIQGIELETIKELDMPTPEAILSTIDLLDKEDLNKFYTFRDDKSFEFINNQHWMIDEIEVVSMNLYEINKALYYLIDERCRIIDSIRRIGTRDDLEDLKVDLILNDYKSKCFEYLKEQKEKELKSKRK